MDAFSRHDFAPNILVYRLAIFCLPLALVVLAACAHRAPPPGGGYRVLGKTYVPLQNAEGFSEVGLASWYGPGFHGKLTANGEVYDMYARTAAHKLLPLGTVVQVTDLDSGRSVKARINDRGPFVDGRIIDLSYTLAKDLQMLDKGTTRVRLTAVAGPRGETPPSQHLEGQFAWQVGAFTVRENAVGLAHSLEKRFGQASVAPYDRGDALFHRVRIGPYQNLDDAQAVLNDLLAAGIHPFLVRVD